MLSETHPDPEELEVTLLGAGVGESCVVHLGHRNWMIVDSFNEPSDGGGLPAAQTYLETLKVARHEVKLIVLTHLHRDHYRGLDDLVRFYTDSRLILPRAIEARRFRGLLSREGRKVIPEVVDAREVAKNRRTDTVIHLQSVSAHNNIAGAAAIAEDVKVLALAPSDAACAEADESLAKAIEDAIDGHNVEAAKAYLEDQNLTSIALHVTAKGSSALLGGDVVNKEPKFGWQAIVDHADTPTLTKSGLFKVPHHGSEGALHEDAMDLLLHPGAINVVTSYTPSEIPKQPELDRLLARGPVWHTSPAATKKSRILDGIQVDYPLSGAVQARRQLGATEWNVASRHPAVEVH